MPFLQDHLDGLLEGHEAPTHRRLYRGCLVIIYLLSIITAFLPLAFSHKPSPAASPFFVMHGIVIIGMVVTLYCIIRWYRTESLHPKFKKLAYFLILTIFIADVATLGDIARINSYEEPKAPAPEPCTPPPSTFSPTFGPTVTPVPPTPVPNTPAPGEFPT
eukprot:Hpha_TRINITY_DN20028_c0_g1::TRINITY_DN20028_c0_g1_i1::g.147681::m.147681